MVNEQTYLRQCRIAFAYTEGGRCLHDNTLSTEVLRVLIICLAEGNPGFKNAGCGKDGSCLSVACAAAWKATDWSSGLHAAFI